MSMERLGSSRPRVGRGRSESAGSDAGSGGLRGGDAAASFQELAEAVQKAAMQLQDALRKQGQRGGTLERYFRRRRASSKRDGTDGSAERSSSTRSRAGSTQSLAESAAGDTEDDTDEDLLPGAPESVKAAAMSSLSSLSGTARLARLNRDDYWGAIGNFFRRGLKARARRGSVAQAARRGSKYRTLRPMNKIDSNAVRSTTREHDGDVRLRGRVLVQGARTNIWSPFWFALRYTGVAFYSSEEACEEACEEGAGAGVGAVVDVFFEDLVLPTGSPVDVVANSGWAAASRTRHSFCMHLEQESVIMAAASAAQMNEYMEAIDMAYAEFIERRIRRKAMIQVAWQLSEDPAGFVRANTINPRASNPHRFSRSRTARISLGRGGSRRQQQQGGKVDAKEVLEEMLLALQEKLDMEYEQLLRTRTMHRCLVAWSAVADFAKANKK